MKLHLENDNTLTASVRIKVRFPEVDAMHIVWHGHYLKYLEDAREEFGRIYTLGYLDVFSFGFMTPIVGLNIDYKSTIKYQDDIEIHITYLNSKAAKIIFDYTIFNHTTGKVAATAQSTQAFVDTEHQLILNNPEFYTDWKKTNNLI